MSRVMVTGASGFVGRAVVRALRDAGHEVEAALRRAGVEAELPSGISAIVVGDISGDVGWERVLRDVDAVVHLAARVHVMRDTASDPLAEFRRVNVVGTERLARAAAAAGVRRIVYMSSVKVHGERSGEVPFDEDAPPAPADPYSVSKLEAETVLRRIGGEHGLEIVVLRPPLVYGAGVGANFLRLMRAVELGVPLPLGLVRNRRSLVYVENLADAVVCSVQAAAAAGETFAVTDGPPVSTRELVLAIGRSLGRVPTLLPVPPLLLRSAGALVGRRAAVERLCGSLEVSSARIRDRLGWRPPVAWPAGIERTVEWYRTS